MRSSSTDAAEVHSNRKIIRRDTNDRQQESVVSEATKGTEQILSSTQDKVQEKDANGLGSTANSSVSNSEEDLRILRRRSRLTKGLGTAASTSTQPSTMPVPSEEPVVSNRRMSYRHSATNSQLASSLSSVSSHSPRNSVEAPESGVGSTAMAKLSFREKESGLLKLAAAVPLQLRAQNGRNTNRLHSSADGLFASADTVANKGSAAAIAVDGTARPATAQPTMTASKIATNTGTRQTALRIVRKEHTAPNSVNSSQEIPPPPPPEDSMMHIQGRAIHTEARADGGVPTAPISSPVMPPPPPIRIKTKSNAPVTTAANANQGPSVVRAASPIQRRAEVHHQNIQAKAGSPQLLAKSGITQAANDRPKTAPPAFPAEDLTAPDTHADPPTDMAIRVVVRKRPISRGEIARGDRDVMDVLPGGEVHMHEPKTRVDLTKYVETSSFTFDDAFSENEDNASIYRRAVLPLVAFAFEGGKASCFAYGQTGSGKTHTLMGADPENPMEDTVHAGLYVQAARDIFALLRTPEHAALTLSVSCFEIYGGKLFDLLNERSVVKCLEDARGNVCTPGLTETVVSDVPSLLEQVATAHARRSIGSTGANETSSRSHLVMHLVLKNNTKSTDEGILAKGVGQGRRSSFRDLSKGMEGAEEYSRVHGKLTFIDLAGSERGADTTNNSKQTRLEGAEINTSLLALKEVIRALANRAMIKRGLWAPKQAHTPFRGSKLTQVLKDSLVGDMARTCMVACVSPAHSNCEHTLNTLRYADRVKEHQSGIDAEMAAVEESQSNNAVSEEPVQRQRRHSIGDANTSSASSPARKPPIASLKAAPAANNGRDLSPFQGQDRRPATSSGVNPARVAAIGAPYNSPGRVPVPRPATAAGGSSGAQPSRRQSYAGIGSNPGAPGVPLRGQTNSPGRSGSPLPPAGPVAAASARTHISSSVRSTTAAASSKKTAAPNTNNGRVAVQNSTSSEFGETANIARTLSLLSAHKKSIADTVDGMKGEMELVQAMEDSEDRDLQLYMQSLEALLDTKERALEALRAELNQFREYRKQSKSST